MQIDEKGFFREATLKICGSLEINKALKQTAEYLMNFFPLDGLGLLVFHVDQGIIEGVAGVSLRGDIPLKGKVALSARSRKILEEAYLKPQHVPRVRIVEKMGEDRLSASVAEYFGISKATSLEMFLELEGKILGVLAVVSLKAESFHKRHSHLLSLLNEPFAIALSNFLRYRQVVDLKEQLADENQYLHDELRKESGREIVGADFGLKGVMEMVRQVSRMNSPVLLIGKTGTGKEVIANAIHNLSVRREMPFIKVNCGSIPETLVDSELFGHEKGAFTGALSQKRGRFERANHGTIFLDEIGELPPSVQVRLLRVLQEKELERVGGSETVRVDIRVIAATHRNLEEMVQKNRFREDLYFRLKVFPIPIPPLRDRLIDMPALAHHFIQKKSLEMGFDSLPILAPGAMDRLKAYHWPGNVRELENVIERAIILQREEPLTFHDLVAKNDCCPVQSVPASSVNPLRLNDVIASHIRTVLKMTNGKVHGLGGTAQLLDVNPSTLRQKMKKLGIPFGRKAKYSTDMVTDEFRGQ